MALLAKTADAESALAGWASPACWPRTGEISTHPMARDRTAEIRIEANMSILRYAEVKTGDGIR
jgi:hypothetical protein